MTGENNQIINVRRIIYTSLINIVISVIVAGLIYTLYFAHPKSGFYCNDPALSFKRKDDSVTSAVLFSGIYFIPLITIITFESLMITFTKSISKNYFQHLRDVLWKWYASYCTILLLNLTIVMIIKSVFGTPRPHFFHTCQPDALSYCKLDTEYITTYECTSSNPSYQIVDSYSSFPSGHTSLSVYCGLFTFWYVGQRAWSWCPSMICALFQLIAITFSIVASLTRISDHRHHWWDVLFGAILGFLLTIYTINCFCDNFKLKSNYKDKNDTSSISSQENFNRELVE